MTRPLHLQLKLAWEKVTKTLYVTEEQPIIDACCDALKLLEQRVYPCSNEDVHPKIQAWRDFSQHMEKYIQERTIPKYDGTFQMDDPTLSDCLFSIGRYTVRNRNEKGKPWDFEKIAHYAQFAWAIVKGAK